MVSTTTTGVQECTQDKWTRGKRKQRAIEPVKELNPNLLYRFQQIQAFFLSGIARGTVKRWIKQGRFPEPVRVSPRLLMWRGSDLLNFFNNGGCAYEESAA